MPSRKVHVVPEGGVWLVRQDGVEEPSHQTTVERDAIQMGREAARTDQAELLVHGRSGEISLRETPKGQ